MPLYNSNVIPFSIAPGAIQTVWSAESPVPGAGGAAASQQVALVPVRGGGGLVHFHGQFSGAPGAFEVDCQVSDTDVDSSYQTMQNLNITTVDATNNTFHAEAITDALFARLLMRSRTNAVSITANIGR